MSIQDPPLGAIVEGPFGKGIVRFSGPTQFKPGKWVGIELYEEKGKNDGSIDGVAYFTCKKGFGVFVRPVQIKVILGNERDSLRAAAGGIGSNTPARIAARPSVGHKRTGSNSGLLRASSANTRTASPSSSSARSISPAKPAASPVPQSARLGRLGQPSPTKKSPTVTLRKPRGSISLRQSPLQQDTPSGTESPITSSPPNGTRNPRVSSPLSLSSSPPQVTPPRASISRPPSSLAQTIAVNTQSPPPPLPPPDDTELQELRAKIRVLEAKRADDAQHIRELETRLTDAEAFVALRPKLQAKLNSQQTELIATRRELADAQQLSELAETRILDTQEQLEMAMLDKEVAEEKAEIAEAEVEDLKERLAIVEVELEVLKEEQEGIEERVANAPEKGSLAFIQLEKQNERLKEALVKLRDMTQEMDHDQRRRIVEMERDMEGLDDLQSRYDSTLIKLSNAETQVEDLKLQLDDALGAEDLLVQLTERNLVLGEKIEEMRITIEDLEALKELSDELEENHIETERNLHEDIENRETQIRAQQLKIDSLEESCQDYESTITQFRDLVLQLQNELESLRTQTQTAQNESATAASQTAQMMYLNLKLQSSASKNQARNIELEIKRIEAKERGDLLSIVQPYLPQLYVESDSDATSSFLYFQRLASKADLINNTLAQTHGLPDSLDGPVSDVVVGICDMRGRISSLSILCKRFAAILRKCDVERFLDVGKIYQEIAPLEKRIDIHIDLLRRDEFREGECVSDVVKLTSQFNHLAELYFSGYKFDLGERELGYLASFDLDIDTFTASIGLAKTSVGAILKEEDVVLDMGGFDITSELLEPLQTLLDKSKSVKASSRKLVKRLEDLIHDSSALKETLISRMESLSNKCQELVNFGISLAQQTLKHVGDARSAKVPFQLTTIVGFAKELASTTTGINYKPGTLWWEAVGETVTQLVQEGGKLLPSILEAENVVKITGIPPWVTRVEEIKASLAVNLEAERKVAQLNDEIQGLVRSLKVKDQSIQELGVKIELQDRRMEAAKKQGDTIVDLEAELAKVRKQEKAYEEAMEQLQADLDALEQDNAKLKTMSAAQERQPTGAQVTETEPVIENLEQAQLVELNESLRNTVRFLRMENMHLKGHDLLKEIESLPPLPPPITRMSTPILDPSGLSDTESDDESSASESPSKPPPPPPTLRSLATETKLLYRDVIQFSSSPKVVDLSELNARRKAGGGVWIPKRKMPAQQVLERKLEAERLSRRVRGLLDRASGIRG
ncbi:dynactin [Marasmius fiardii PR-910]|nr:dynactin [Marasmius fiardii PR-910]